MTLSETHNAWVKRFKDHISLYAHTNHDGTYRTVHYRRVVAENEVAQLAEHMHALAEARMYKEVYHLWKLLQKSVDDLFVVHIHVERLMVRLASQVEDFLPVIRTCRGELDQNLNLVESR